MSESLYSPSDFPTTEDFEGGVSLGTIVAVAVAGKVTNLAWYCGPHKPDNESALPFSLYDADTEALLARIVVNGIIENSWNVPAIAPVSVTAGQRLIPTVYTEGWHVYSNDYFVVPHVSGNLVAPASAEDPIGNGRFIGGSEAYPNRSFRANNYWTDLRFVADGDPTGTSLSVWNDLTEVAADLRVWNGSTEVAAYLDSIV